MTTANTDKRIGLHGTYDTRGTTVKLHTPGCAALNRANPRNGKCLPMGAVDADDLADLDEREFTTVICKCAR